jgi:hypothetical protein
MSASHPQRCDYRKNAVQQKAAFFSHSDRSMFAFASISPARAPKNRKIDLVDASQQKLQWSDFTKITIAADAITLLSWADDFRRLSRGHNPLESGETPDLGVK